jgi:hypothetical protein
MDKLTETCITISSGWEQLNDCLYVSCVLRHTKNFDIIIIIIIIIIICGVGLSP